jgi:hypothetical protein
MDPDPAPIAHPRSPPGRRFSPTEVEDCARLLRCEVPNLDASMAPLERPLNGRVLRPWCHFDLPDSDYVAGGRRNPDMPGPSGACAGDRGVGGDGGGEGPPSTDARQCEVACPPQTCLPPFRPAGGVVRAAGRLHQLPTPLSPLNNKNLISKTLQPLTLNPEPRRRGRAAGRLHQLPPPLSPKTHLKPFNPLTL